MSKHLWWPGLCDCGHRKAEHKRKGRGPCTGLDSYGIECKCWSFEDNDKD